MLRLAGIAGILGIALAAIGVGQSPASFPGQNGLIAYDAGGSICVMEPDGSQRRRVTYAFAWDGGPAWAPDGRRLAFVTTRRWRDLNADVRFDVFIYDRRRLHSISGPEETRDTGPTWSPDGQQVAAGYAEPRLTGVPFSILNADGSARREVVPGDEPDWSPDGHWIVYYSDIPTEVGAAGIYLIRPDGSGKRRLTSGHSPAWSPDAAQIAFASGGIYAINPDGTGLRRITDGPDYGPAWSPDGSRIAFVRMEARNWDIWAVAPDGSGLRNLTNTPNILEFSPNWQRTSESEQFELPRGARGCGQKLADSDEPSIHSQLEGGPHDDLVFARAGNDRVSGHGGGDILYGGSGNDVVSGGAGKDDLRGGSGRDVLGARDGVADHIRCGPGRDRVVADRRDVIARDCERVSRR